MRDKIALFCDVERRPSSRCPPCDSIYEVPLLLEDAGLGDFVIERLRLEATATPRTWPNGASWSSACYAPQVQRCASPSSASTSSCQDAYLSVQEALIHAGWAVGRDVEIRWVDSGDADRGQRSTSAWPAWHGIVVPGGFGERGIEGKIAAARYARENNVPYLGLCLGMQAMVIEFARHVLGDGGRQFTPSSTRDAQPRSSICMPEQRDISDKGGTMRLGGYACHA